MSPGRELRLGVGDLLNRSGTRREVSRDLAVPELEVSGSTVPGGSTARLDLVVESTADPSTLAVTGTVVAPWRGSCRRCLEAVEGDLEVELHEIVARDPIDEEVWALDGEEIDLGSMIREALLLALPLAPLCGDDCLGPAPEEFPAAPAADAAGEGEGVDDEQTRLADPRWAALDELRFED